LRKLKNGYNNGCQLTYLNMNGSREDRFKNAIADFSFHSTFIGCYMLTVERINQLHKISVIAAYLYPKYLHFSNRYFEIEELYLPIFQGIFMSYREDVEIFFYCIALYLMVLICLLFLYTQYILHLKNYILLWFSL